jgi:arabinofuranan 3-O-arabinosyltransferase
MTVHAAPEPQPVRAAAALLGFAYLALLAQQLTLEFMSHVSDGFTNGEGRPLGDDFINFWAAAVLALNHRVSEIYDFAAFHAFEQAMVAAPLDFHHYSYPPVLLILTAPLAALPFVPALATWLLAGWSCLVAALRLAMPGRQAMLLALAAPAVVMNTVCGQNGTFSAALIGGGLTLLDRRPVLAGLLLGLLAFKPHLGLLIPVALIAGRRWHTLAAAALSAVGLVLASILLFGPEPWAQYLHNTAVLRHDVLEHGHDIWRRMVSVFVLARSLGADVPVAYAVQAASAIAAATVVAILWLRHAALPLRATALVLGTFLSTPYLFDYDLVVAAFIAAWLAPAHLPDNLERPGAVAVVLLLVLPYLANPVGLSTGIAPGALLILPALLVTIAAAMPAVRSLAGAAGNRAAPQPGYQIVRGSSGAR